MKKLLVALLAVSSFTAVFAKDVVATDSFDSTKMVCGGRAVSDGDKIDDLKGRCQRFQDHKTNIVFWDEHSKKLVHCKVNKVGDIALAECKAN